MKFHIRGGGLPLPEYAPAKMAQNDLKVSHIIGMSEINTQTKLELIMTIFSSN